VTLYSKYTRVLTFQNGACVAATASCRNIGPSGFRLLRDQFTCSSRGGVLAACRFSVRRIVPEDGRDGVSALEGDIVVRHVSL
jgi:hypothetical protein